MGLEAAYAGTVLQHADSGGPGGYNPPSIAQRIVDPQGRFAGMVDLSSTAVAGAGAVNQATLIPVETLRAFLQTQNVSPASGRTPIDQSVVRVICVRK